jgi:hypothetical protein
MDFESWLVHRGKEDLDRIANSRSRSFILLVTVTAYLESDADPRSGFTPLSGYQWGNDIMAAHKRHPQATRLRLCFTIEETQGPTDSLTDEITHITKGLDSRYVVTETYTGTQNTGVMQDDIHSPSLVFPLFLFTLPLSPLFPHFFPHIRNRIDG